MHLTYLGSFLKRYLETERFFCIEGFEIYSLIISEVSERDIDARKERVDDFHGYPNLGTLLRTKYHRDYSGLLDSHESHRLLRIWYKSDTHRILLPNSSRPTSQSQRLTMGGRITR